MSKITNKNLYAVARDIKALAREVKTGKKDYSEIAIVYNKNGEVSLLDTFSACYIDKDYLIGAMIFYHDLTVKKISEYVTELKQMILA